MVCVSPVCVCEFLPPLPPPHSPPNTFTPTQSRSHDDASAYYNSTRNVFAYSPFALKSDFGGHDQASFFSPSSSLCLLPS